MLRLDCDFALYKAPALFVRSRAEILYPLDRAAPTRTRKSDGFVERPALQRRMRRPSLAAIAQEVADVFTEKGYKVLVQDYDMAQVLSKRCTTP